MRFPLLFLAPSIIVAKISIHVHRALEVANMADIAIEFHAAETSAPRSRIEGMIMDDHRTAVYRALRAAADAAAAQLAGVLNVTCTTFWIKKSAVCRGLTHDQVHAVANLDLVQRVIQPFSIHLNSQPLFVDAASSSDNDDATTLAAEPQWGVDTIGAPAIWNHVTGRGVVVGSIDTGAAFRHEAIQHNWRKTKGWFNPYNESSVHPLPIDTDGHGTHTIGTMVGAHGIGVAPDAQWISCLGLYGGDGTHEALVACLQFMMCPTDLDGTHPDCTLGADVVNNSWGDDDGLDGRWLADILDVYHTVGIVPVFSNGNTGPRCTTIDVPANSPRVLSVGAVGSFANNPNALAYFSSKGPATTVVNDTTTHASANYTVQRIKPDVVAPGMFVRSADAANLTGYVRRAGSSMAAPHVTGAVALLKQAWPRITYDELYALLTTHADRAMLEPEPHTWHYPNGTIIARGAVNCGGVLDTAWPNNRFGYGRVNVAAILDGVLHSPGRSSSTPPPANSIDVITFPVATPASTLPSPDAQATEPQSTTGGCDVPLLGVDFVGHDIVGIPALQLHDCCGVCAVYRGCRGFSYFEGTCWLKSDVSTTIDKAGVTSVYVDQL
ncbi:Aste57867_22234 [Aphanomyces stellatus]|uniref:subtilisin n=1 Tax=Aphanomyces stellatus TaxID=120398 RepID=A0A485LJK8_9STRA|nr:hypothetical protein As57867_022165 [Aphanomyces stellatus]VFT98901.1 Aste57867_22234 [Aphanomyces stellatus]